MVMNNGIIIREYKPEDYLAISRRKLDMMTYLNFPDPVAISQNLGKGPAFTGTSNGDIIACAGVLIFWKGVGEGWAVTSPLVEKYKLTFAKVIHEKLTEIIKNYSLERVQTVVDAEHKISQEWLKRMGFGNETPDGMRKYIGGRTYYRFSLVKGD